MRYPLLSFLELQRLSKLLQGPLTGARVDRIFIPECPEHPQGFFKNEWVLELFSSGSGASQLLVSLRAQACGLALLPGKVLRPSRAGTRSGFDLGMAKELEGLKIASVTELAGERMIRVSFKTNPKLDLYLNLMPALPEGVLIAGETVLASTKQRKDFPIPEPRTVTPEVLEKIPDRKEMLVSLEHYSNLWMEARTAEAIALRKQKLVTHLERQLQGVRKKLISLEQQAEQSRQDPDWNYYGSLLQTHFHAKPRLVNKHYSLMDYEKGEEVLVPGDAKLGLKQQLEKYFHQAKRNKKRIEEAATRSEILVEKKSELENLLGKLKTGVEISLESLQKIEQTSLVPSPTIDRDSGKKLSTYAGKTYRSKEGFTILSGRSKDENLELTFKVARGNDLWLHVKGRPGSHTIILLPPKKTASLDTLLDAANLCILHSGGKEWGKTEVDYTQRKNVKKIKNQTEVSYSGNKTLMVTIENDRLKRLYGED